MKYAGCNYSIHPPGGDTAFSMHDCDGCSHDGDCKMQKDTDEWTIPADYDALCDKECVRHRGRNDA